MLLFFLDELEVQLPAAAFVFSPPLTRHRSRRMSLTSGGTTPSSVGLLPKLPEEDTEKSTQSNVVSQSPAKRHKKSKTRPKYKENSLS